MKKALLVSVGGSPTPVIHSINSQRPEYLIFFASNASRQTAVEAVLPVLEQQPRDREFIMTPDEQDLEACVAAIIKRLPEILRTWRIGYDELAADYTGGTKTMSAAVVLALANHIDQFSYVGGIERDKAGLGVVLDGREQMLYLKNPWNELALEALSDMALLFNRCRFQSVADLAERTARRSPARRQLFEGLKAAAEAYYFWDGFQYDRALTELKKADSRLRAVASETDQKQLRHFQKAVADSLDVLEEVVAEQNVVVKTTPKMRGATVTVRGNGTALIRDLLSSAVRRAEAEHKYDDAVARLYSALEKMAKLRLKMTYGVDNSNVRLDQLPASLVDEFQRDCSNAREGGMIQLPLHKSYQLLAEYGDPLGDAYHTNETELGKILSERNRSLLAHGFKPVKIATYENMLVITLRFLNIGRDDLPSFPRMDWEEDGA